MPRNLVAGALRGGLFTRVVGRRVLFFQAVTSTMDEAAREAQAGTEEGTVVVAETQLAGRGRMGRGWVSREGNLHLSVVFRPTLQALPLMGVAAGVAVARAIRKASGLEPRLKWPNDVLVEGKKVGGILVESVVAGDAVSYVVAGIGINVSLDTGAEEEIAGLAGSLNALAGRSISREDLLRQLLHELDALYLQVGRGGSPLREWRALLETLGRRVEARWREDSYAGLAEAVDETGNLLLRLDDGRLITLTAGDVTLQEQEGH